MIRNPYPDLDRLETVVSHPPEHIWIEPTTRCNTRCRHCTHFYLTFGEDMTAEVYEKIRDQVLDGVQVAELVGYGEPLISPLYNRIFSDCVSRGIQLMCTTNGIRLDSDDKIRPFVENDLRLTLSLEGADKATYERVRPHIPWEQTLAVLERIRRVAAEAGPRSRFLFAFNFAAMRHNIAQLPDLVRLAARYGVKKIEVIPITAAEERPELADQSLRDAPELVAPAYNEALALAARIGVDINLPQSFLTMMIEWPPPGRGPMGRLRRWGRKARIGWRILRLPGRQWGWLLTRLLFWPPPRAKTGIRFCRSPWVDAYFEAGGKFRPCCMIQSPFGDLNTQSWEAIWNGRLMRHLRRSIHRWNPPVECRRCGAGSGINGGDEGQYDRFFSRFRVETVPIDSDEPQYENFHPLERTGDGQPSHRWMGRRGAIALPARPGARFIRLTIFSALPGQGVHIGEGAVNGGAPEPFDDTHPEVIFPLDGVAPGAQWRIEMAMDGLYDSGPDGREIGLGLRAIQILY